MRKLFWAIAKPFVWVWINTFGKRRHTLRAIYRRMGEHRPYHPATTPVTDIFPHERDVVEWAIENGRLAWLRHGRTVCRPGLTIVGLRYRRH